MDDFSTPLLVLGFLNVFFWLKNFFTGHRFLAFINFVAMLLCFVVYVITTGFGLQ